MNKKRMPTHYKHIQVRSSDVEPKKQITNRKWNRRQQTHVVCVLMHNVAVWVRVCESVYHCVFSRSVFNSIQYTYFFFVRVFLHWIRPVNNNTVASYNVNVLFELKLSEENGIKFTKICWKNKKKYIERIRKKTIFIVYISVRRECNPYERRFDFLFNAQFIQYKFTCQWFHIVDSIQLINNLRVRVQYA